jgi:hypothetical protein
MSRAIVNAGRSQVEPSTQPSTQLCVLSKNLNRALRLMQDHNDKWFRRHAHTLAY